jgi:hypothetical protein
LGGARFAFKHLERTFFQTSGSNGITHAANALDQLG